jgi:transcriptional regulator with XRE-family HTH domain
MPKVTSHLKSLRVAAGLSQRELARVLGVHHSNVGFWERTGTPPRSDLLPPIARALGVSVDALLGGSGKRSGTQTPGGRLGEVFQQVAKLPRGKQQRIIGVVKALVAQEQPG